ncbi:MAG TPA: DUF364 domain-containing protein [Stellaceae bacterium]|nr:DUF364 domain-containing protein [Stellaceae bacterium]
MGESSDVWSALLPDGILTETIACVTDILGADFDDIAIERAVVGLFFTGVKLSCGTAGTCATPHAAVPGDVCCPIAAHGAGWRKLAGRPAAELMRDAAAPEGLARALGIATLNALAELAWRRRPYPGADLVAGVDAFDATEIRAGDRVVLVGAFIPFLKELKRRRLPYLVLEKNPASLKPEEMPFYRPAEAAADIVPAADVLLVSGSTLLNDTLEDLLAWARPEARVTIVGPTVGILPDAFFARGADILGAVRIARPDEFLDLLAEGGSAPHFLGRSAQKIVLARRAGCG